MARSATRTPTQRRGRGLAGWPGVGRAATTEAASVVRGPRVARTPSQRRAGRAEPGGGWRGDGQDGASGEGQLCPSDVAARRPAGRGYGEHAPKRPLAALEGLMSGNNADASDVPPGAHRAGGWARCDPVRRER